MQQEKSNIEQLLADYCIGELGKEEGQILKDWVAQCDANRQEAIAFVRAYRKGRLIRFLSIQEEQDVFKTVKQAVANRKKSRVLRWSSVAASVIVLLSVAATLMLFRSQPIEERLVAEGLKKPWSNQAVLTFENGEEIGLGNDTAFIIQRGQAVIDNDGEAGVSYRMAQNQTANKDKKTEHHTLTVPRGGEFKTTLSDGTVVWLNSGSKLSYPALFNGKTREVHLVGEAYFEVAKDDQKPFVVHTQTIQTKVLGTAFNVSAYSSDNFAAVTLEEGEVEVQTANETRTLAPGIQARFVRADGSLQLYKVDAYYYTSWRGGVFSFNDLTLEDLCVKLSRWYDVDFEFHDEQLKQKRLNGAVKKDKSLNFILHVIELTSEIEFLLNENNRIEIK
jgi:ferric-dicitrate binding protein FerR (iron transport regulator)